MLIASTTTTTIARHHQWVGLSGGQRLVLIALAAAIAAIALMARPVAHIRSRAVVAWLCWSAVALALFRAITSGVLWIALALGSSLTAAVLLWWFDFRTPPGTARGIPSIPEGPTGPDSEDGQTMAGDTFNVHAHGDHGTAIGKVEIGSQSRTLGGGASGLTASLTTFGGTDIHLLVPIGDGEAYSFGTEVKHLLERAGWSVHGVDQAAWTGPPVTGIVLRFEGESAASLPALKNFGEGLLQRGFKVTGNTGCEENAIWIGHNN